MPSPRTKSTSLKTFVLRVRFSCVGQKRTSTNPGKPPKDRRATKKKPIEFCRPPECPFPHGQAFHLADAIVSSVWLFAFGNVGRDKEIVKYENVAAIAASEFTYGAHTKFLKLQAEPCDKRTAIAG